MADTMTRRGRGWSLVALRGVLMLLGGLYALIFPGLALTVLVVLGGALLLVDGALGLWSLTFGGARTGNYWFDIVRNALALLTGIIILVSPLLATIFTVTFLIYLVAFQAIIVGVMEIIFVIRQRGVFSSIWPVLLSGVLYVVFGLLLIFFPLSSAVALVQLGGVLMIIFAIGLFALAWRLRRVGV
ncbi:MAG: hypothetical protein JWN11_909 [Hyphomicrobiales bacterium]|nr:hypothetical protein [Hyphomicrobiales bacterium]